MYFHLDGDNPIEINGTYVEDLLRCGIKRFEDKEKHTYYEFENLGTEELPLTFAGVNIQKKTEDLYALNQLFYHRRLEHLPAEADFLSST